MIPTIASAESPYSTYTGTRKRLIDPEALDAIKNV